MAGKVLSMEVGYSMTKVCEMEYQGKKQKVYKYFSIPTPEGTLTDGLLNLSEEYVNSLKAELAKRRMKTKDVIFTISSSKIASREIRIPYCKEAQIGNLVRMNLSDYFPIDVSQYSATYTILEVEGAQGENDKKSKAKPTGYKLLVLAAPNAILNSYRMLATALKLNVKEIDYCGNSVYQAAKEACEEGVQMVAKIDVRSSLLLVQKDGRIVLTRTIPYGIQNGEEAEVVSLIEGISKVVDYYNSNHGSDIVERIYLTGVGSDFPNICEMMESEIVTEVRALKTITGINAEKVFKENAFGEYVACIGAALAPVHFASDKEEDSAKGAKGGTDPLRLTIILSIGCVLIGVVLVLTALFPYLEEKEKQEEYNAIIEQLEPVYSVYVGHQSLKAQTEHMEALDEQTVNRNAELVEFISALESKMPTSFCLNDMTTTANGIVMNVTVKTKEEAAVVLNALRELESFSFIDTTALSEVVTEIGEEQYSFAVEMVYAPIIEEQKEE